MKNWIRDVLMAVGTADFFLNFIKLETLRIRVERLENERKDIDNAITAAAATVAANWDRAPRNYDCVDSLDGCDCDCHGSAGNVQGDRAAAARADHGDIDGRVSVVLGHGMRARTYIVEDWEPCNDVMNCDHEDHSLLGRKVD
jgi:hypothetical protein